jgi:hypothetical protein
VGGADQTEGVMASLLARHAKLIKGVLSCFDRIVLQGTLPQLCYAQGMTAYLNQHKIRIFDYPKWAEPLRDRIRTNAETLAAAEGIEIEFVRKLKSFRKEDRIAEILKRRGMHPGLVHILSAMESCPSYKPWHDKQTHQTFLKPDSGKCLHYYFYFIDEELGLCYLRVPTWAPFRLQFYCNGHNRLAIQLSKRGIAFEQIDNAFVDIADFSQAQALADQWQIKTLHRALDRFARRYCPILRPLQTSYHWSIMQVEHSTDIVFRDRAALASIYEPLIRTAIHAVRAEHVATFLGRKLTAASTIDVGTDFTTRIEGTRIKHRMGSCSIKLYDKFGVVLRIETTSNDVSFFKHHRWVEHRDGTRAFELASVRKTIYSLCPDVQALLGDANRRYLEFLGDLGDPHAGLKAVQKISDSVTENNRTYRGFNFFDRVDLRLFETIARGEFQLSGMRNRDLREHTALSVAQICQRLKRLRLHGLIKRVGKTYKYYLTELGRRAVLAALKLRALHLIPALAPQPAH